MTTVMGIHEVEDGSVWANAWRKGPGSRHELFGNLGVKARTFRDPNNPDLTGVLFEVPDLGKFQTLLESEEGKTAMREDGIKVDTLRVLTEFTP